MYLGEHLETANEVGQKGKMQERQEEHAAAIFLLTT